MLNAEMLFQHQELIRENPVFKLQEEKLKI